METAIGFNFDIADTERRIVYRDMPIYPRLTDSKFVSRFYFVVTDVLFNDGSFVRVE